MAWRSIRWTLSGVVLLASLLSGYRSASSFPDPADTGPSSGSALSAGGEKKTRDDPGREASRLTPTEQLLKFCAVLPNPDLSESERDTVWRLIKGMGAEEIRQTLAELETLPVSSAAAQITTHLYYRWAQLDPGAAAQAAVSENHYISNPNLRCVLTAWIKTDPDAALAWAGEEGHEEALNPALGLLAGYQIAQGNPPDADRFFKLGIGATGALSKAMARRPEDRDAFVKAATEQLSPEDAEIAIVSLYSNWLAADPDGAVRDLKDSSLFPVMKAYAGSDPRTYSISQRLMQDPVGAMAWAAQPETGISPQQQIAIFNSWNSFDSPKSIAWLEQKQDPEFTAAAVKFSALDVLGFNRNDRYTEDLRNRVQVWQRQQPAAAETWMNSLPESFRSTLTTPP